MVDNVAITAGTGTTVATDDVGGVHYQLVKLAWGPLDTANVTDVASGKPIPMQLRVSDGTAWTYGAGASAAGSPRVTLASDSPPGTAAYSASATFTPAATSHTGGSAGVIGDCNGAAGTFSLSAPSGARLLINSATLEIDNASAEATAWRVYLYNVTPPSALADDAALTFDSGDRASFLGYIDLGTAVDHGNTLWVENHNIGKQILLSGTGVFGYLVNLTTVTPGNVAHIVTLHATLL